VSPSTPDAAHERCKARQAAEILSLPYPGSFNRRRRALQRVWDRGKQTTKPYPEFDSPEKRRAFDRSHILVVPEWGGRSAFGSDWTYSVEKCRAWTRGDLFASASDPE